MPMRDGSGPRGDGRPGRGLGPCGRDDSQGGRGMGRGQGGRGDPAGSGDRAGRGGRGKGRGRGVGFPETGDPNNNNTMRRGGWFRQ